jgi:hypothetical protein
MVLNKSCLGKSFMYVRGLLVSMNRSINLWMMKLPTWQKNSKTPWTMGPGSFCFGWKAKPVCMVKSSCAPKIKRVRLKEWSISLIITTATKQSVFHGANKREASATLQTQWSPEGIIQVGPRPCHRWHCQVKGLCFLWNLFYVVWL